jgi:hypothetical protein
VQQPNIVSRIGAWLLLFARGATWVGVLGYFALFTGASFALSSLLADPVLAYRIAGRFTFVAASVAQFVVWAIVALFLARKLGDGPAQTAWGIWLALAVAYFLIAIMLPGLAQGWGEVWLQDDPQLIFPVATGFNLFWNSAVFPLFVWFIAAGHSGRAIGPRAILAYLTESGFGLWAMYIAFLLASLLVDLAVARVLGGEAGTLAGVIVQQFVAAVRAAATVLFAIMTYREIRAAAG